VIAITTQLGFLTSAITAVVMMVMVWLGLRHGVFEARKESRRCAACGRLIQGGVCEDCTPRGR
jgi:hypothetical protein